MHSGKSRYRTVIRYGQMESLIDRLSSTEWILQLTLCALWFRTCDAAPSRIFRFKRHVQRVPCRRFSRILFVFGRKHYPFHVPKSNVSSKLDAKLVFSEYSALSGKPQQCFQAIFLFFIIKQWVWYIGYTNLARPLTFSLVVLNTFGFAKSRMKIYQL